MIQGQFSAEVQCKLRPFFPCTLFSFQAVFFIYYGPYKCEACKTVLQLLFSHCYCFLFVWSVQKQWIEVSLY
jgi:hypothetical protein